MKLRDVSLCCLALSCTRPGVSQAPSARAGGGGDARRGEAEQRFPSLPARPGASASAAFWTRWSDGRAELSGYRATVSRYGELRPAELVLIYVTEPMNRRTWIKDDDAPEADRVNVLKLNVSLKFQTGIYPYSVLTSVFSPVDRYRSEAFAPAKITLSVQEWCGHVFYGVWPGDDRFTSQVFSYFASEGERRDEASTPAGTLYEDALFIQLRELDGPFAGGRDWHGPLVPTLWATRRAHRALRPLDATITRTRATREGAPVNRFDVRYEGFSRTLDVEVAEGHRILGWTASDGESVSLLRTERLPYWQLNHNGDEPRRADLGLDGGARE